MYFFKEVVLIGKILIGLGAGISAFIVGILMAFIMFIPLMMLWNWLRPNMFGLKEITLLQAWGISWLSTILFRK